MENPLIQVASRYISFTPEEAEAIIALVPVRTFPAGTVLLRAGQIAVECFFIIQGCIRQYYLMDGVEKTTDFFTEEQAVVSFASYAMQQPASHYLVCVEDCTLVVGRLDTEAEMYQKFPKLEVMSRLFMQEDFGKVQEAKALFMTSSPEERYRQLLDARPDLLQRVPQHQLASYLGVTPESLSRIRKRIAQRG